MILRNHELRMKYLWVPAKDVTDLTYWCPHMKFMREVSDKFWEIITEYDLDKWKKFWDCDNFAMTYHTVAHAHFAKEYAKQVQADSPAVGQISYTTWNSKHERPGTGHRINTYIDQEGRVRYLEPQAVRSMALDKEFVSLLEKERKTIWSVYF